MYNRDDGEKQDSNNDMKEEIQYDRLTAVAQTQNQRTTVNKYYHGSNSMNKNKKSIKI